MGAPSPGPGFHTMRGHPSPRLTALRRPDQVSVLDSYQYDDGCESCGNDTFSREPAVVKFSSPSTKVKEFAIVPLHAAPSDAVAEINSLYDVYLDVRKKWDLEVRLPPRPWALEALILIPAPGPPAGVSW